MSGLQGGCCKSMGKACVSVGQSIKLTWQAITRKPDQMSTKTFKTKKLRITKGADGLHVSMMKTMV